jgi:Zn-finger nucleic acid-binding protein
MPAGDRRCRDAARALERAIAGCVDDPYRSSQNTGTCPRCQAQTVADGELDRLVCERGCGEWYPRTRLDQLLAWQDVKAKPGGRGFDGQPAEATAWPWGAALCPICQSEMSIGFRAELRFDYCSQHGVWLDAGEIERFAQLFRPS